MAWQALGLVTLTASYFMLQGCVAQNASTSMGSSDVQADASGLIISNVTVVSPERDTPLEHGYVRILEGRIAEVSERPLRGEQEIDGTGRYLIPGLIDSHVHLAVPPGFPAVMTAEQAAAFPEIVAAQLAQDPKSYLFFGFTTVVDLVGSTERAARWNALDVRPDAYFCGGAAMVDGHIQRVPAPIFSYVQSGQIDPVEHTPQAAAARIAADGAVCIKTFYDSGSNVTVEEAKALVAAAHERDLPVVIHVNRKDTQAFAVAAGVDAIVHGMWRNPGDAAELDTEAREILAEIATEGIGYQPTIQVLVGVLDMTNRDYLDRPAVADVYPRSVIDWYASEEGSKTANLIRSANLEDRYGGTIGLAMAGTRLLAEADAHLLFGSDTPSAMLYTNPPGLNGRLEMNNWIASGVSEKKLFKALTIDNARMFGLDEEIGTIEQGKTANMVLLGANPLGSVEAYDTIEVVFLHGRAIQREQLSARNAGDPAQGS